MIVSEVYDDNDWNAKLQTTGIVVGVSMNMNAVNIKKNWFKKKNDKCRRVVYSS